MGGAEVVAASIEAGGQVRRPPRALLPCLGLLSVLASVLALAGPAAAQPFRWSLFPREWSVVPSPTITEAELRGDSCISPRFCVAVGAAKPNPEPQVLTVPLIEEWNGIGWSVVPAPPVEVVPPQYFHIQRPHLSGVSCTSPGFCMAVGGYRYAGPTPSDSWPVSIIDAWNGTTWSPAGGGGGESLEGVSCVSPSFCLAVGHGKQGEDGTYSLVESWNGEAWSAVPVPVCGKYCGSALLNGVSCASATFCMAVGRHGYAQTLAVSWNGKEPSVVPTSYRGGWEELNSVSCVSARDCVAVGSGGNAPLVESWNGETWSILETPSPKEGELNGVSCVWPRSCAAVGRESTKEGPRTLVETSIGGKWSIVPSANPGNRSYLNGVSCLWLAWQSCVAVGADEVTPEAPEQPLLESGGIF